MWWLEIISQVVEQETLDSKSTEKEKPGVLARLARWENPQQLTAWCFCVLILHCSMILHCFCFYFSALQRFPSPCCPDGAENTATDTKTVKFTDVFILVLTIFIWKWILFTPENISMLFYKRHHISHSRFFNKKVYLRWKLHFFSRCNLPLSYKTLFCALTSVHELTSLVHLGFTHSSPASAPLPNHTFTWQQPSQIITSYTFRKKGFLKVSKGTFRKSNLCPRVIHIAIQYCIVCIV